MATTVDLLGSAAPGDLEIGLAERWRSNAALGHTVGLLRSDAR